MAYCPKPASAKKTNNGTPGKKTVNAPAPRTESCGPSSTTTVVGGTGGSTTNTVYVPGPAGPAGKDGTIGWGFKYEGQFELNKQYKKQSEENPLASVVSYNGSTYVAIADNISQTEENPEFEPDNSPETWSLLSRKGEGGGLAEEEKGFFETLQDDIFDWVKNASVGELILAGLGVAGVVWAGSKVVKMIAESGTGGPDGTPPSTYDGSPGFVTTGYTPPKVADVIANLCAVAEDVSVDVSQVKDETCSFIIGGVTQIRNVLQQLSLAYQFSMVDTAGSLKFVAHTTVPVKSLTIADMGFSGSPAIPAAPFTTKRYQGITLPKRVTLTYMSPDVGYNIVTQSADFHTFEEGQVVQLSVPVSLTHQKAKQIAEQTLINAHLQAQNYTWTGTYKDIDLEVSDVVDSAVHGLVRIMAVNESEEGLLEFTGVDAGAPEALIPSNQNVFIPPPSTNIPTVVGYSQAFFIDPPNLNDSDTGVRIYVAAHGYDVPGWPGCDVWVSENGGASYDLVDSVTREATLGLVEAATPVHDYHTWDNDTQIVVRLKTNSLLSVSDKDVLNGKNWAMIGQEMIGFANATLIGEKTYRLSRLLRGRQGTEQYIPLHQPNELFCLLDDTLVPIEWETADRMTTKRYKVVTRGAALDKVEGEDVMMVSNNTLMWTPLNAKVLKVGDDFQFSWDSRARYNNQLRDLSTSGNDTDRAGSGIVIYDADGTTVKGKHTVSGDSFTYTAAMQIKDFGAVQSTVKAAIAQISKDYGAGYPVIVNS